MSQSDKNRADEDEQRYAFQEKWHLLRMDDQISDYEQAEHYDSIVDDPIDIHHRQVVQNDVFDVSTRVPVNISAREMIEGQATDQKSQTQNQTMSKNLFVTNDACAGQLFFLPCAAIALCIN